MRILGVDPGIHGGLAVIEMGRIDGSVHVIICTDIPVVGAGTKERVDVQAIRTLIRDHQPVRAVIERAGVMPRQGISSGFKYGRAVGAIEAAIMLCEIPLEIVEPAVWKRFFRLIGKDKEASRLLAYQRLPSAHEYLKRKKDHGRAEACLLAVYAYGGSGPDS